MQPSENEKKRMQQEFDNISGYLLERDEATAEKLLEAPQEKVDLTESLTTILPKLELEESDEESGWIRLAPEAARNPSEAKVPPILKTNLKDDILLLEKSRIIRKKVEKAEWTISESFPHLLLVLGSLKWKEEKESPLIFLPLKVNCDKSEGHQWLGLRQSDLEPFLNPSLQAKLEEEGLKFPEFSPDEFKENSDQYLTNYLKEIEAKLEETKYKEHGWEVVEKAYLSDLVVPSVLMHADLLAYRQDVAEHQVFKEIMTYGKQNASENNTDAHQGKTSDDAENNVDECYLVTDADSSQIQAIKSVKAGKNVLINGPPGSGKSQTIVNIIAELLEKKKKVLFVSAEIAGLKVVKEKFDKVGLDDFCLELHDEKANTTQFRNTLMRQLGTPDKDESVRNSSDTPSGNEGKKLEGELNKYSQSLHNSSELEKSLFELIGIVASARESVPYELLLAFADISTDNLANALPDLDALKEIVASLEVKGYGSVDLVALPNNPMDSNTLSSLMTNVDSLVKKIDDLDVKDVSDILLGEDSLKILRDGSGKLEEFKTAAESVRLFIKGTPFKNGIPFKANLHLKVEKEDCEQGIKTCSGFRELIKKLDFDVKQTMKDLNAYLNKSKGWKLWELVHFSKRPKWTEEDQKIIEEIEQFYPSRSSEGYRSDVNRKQISEVIEELGKLEKYYKDKLIILDLGELPKTFEKIEELSASDKNFEMEFYDQLSEILQDIKCLLDKGALTELEEKSLEELKTHLEDRIKESEKTEEMLSELSENLNVAEKWKEFQDDPILKQVCEFITKNKVESQYLEQWVKGSVNNSILKPRIKEFEFNAETHRSNIKKFCEFDDNMIKSNAERLANKLRGERVEAKERDGDSYKALRDRIQSGNSSQNGEDYQITIKTLLSSYHKFIQELMPCFIMDTLSVARYCEPKVVEFDVVIFDEASQIRPEEALGALLRGQQVVVVGDDKQSAPKHKNKTRPPDDIPVQRDSDESTLIFNENPIYKESTLQMCLPFTNHLLTWNYRSQPEALVSFSNEMFYNNEIRIFPSPSGLGLEFNHSKNKDCFYKGGVNKGEATRVAKWVMQYYNENPYSSKKSIGIITCTEKQVKEIQDAIAELRDKPPVEPIVKHINDIQGSEYDIVLFSVAFGLADKDKKKVNNKIFVRSSLFKPGGDRLLNVLITRGKEGFVVFTNFLPSQLTLPSQPVLTEFFKYVQDPTHWRQKNRDNSYDSIALDDSLEKTVLQFLKDELRKDKLQDKDYLIRTPEIRDVYKIPFGIYDDKKGKYLLAIELDDEQYHEFSEARDRDKIRPRMLKELGWRTHQVLSIDWYVNPDREKQLIREAIDFAAAEEKFSEQPDEYLCEQMKAVFKNAPSTRVVRRDLIGETVEKLSAEFKEGDDNEVYNPFFEGEDFKTEVKEKILQPRLQNVLERDQRKSESVFTFHESYGSVLVSLSETK